MSAYKFLNESLLDDVETDEVEDVDMETDDFISVSLDAITEIRHPYQDDYMKNYNSEKMCIPDKVRSVLDAYKAMGVVKSWEVNDISDTMNVVFKMSSSDSMPVFLDLFVRMFLPRHCMECGYVYSILVCKGGSANYAKIINYVNRDGVKYLDIVDDDVFYNIVRTYYPDASDETILKQFVRSYGRWQAELELVSKIRLIRQDDVEPRENVVDGSGNLVSEEWFWNCANTGISEDVMVFAVKEQSGTDPLRYGYFDMVSKKRLTDEFYSFAHPFSDGLGLVKTIGGSWKFIDRNGNDFLDELDGKEIVFANPFENGFAEVKIRNDYTFIDKNGNFLTSETFGNCYGFSKDGLATVEDYFGKRKFIDTSGNYVGGSYDSSGSFSDGFAVVVKKKFNVTYNGLCYNYMDAGGNEVFDDWLMYETKDFMNGFGIVGKRDKNNSYRVKGYNYLTRGKKFLLSEWFYRCHRFKNGFAVVERENGMCNIVDEHGKFVSGDRWFDKCYDFSEGFAVVSDAAHSKRHDRSMNYIDTNGQFLFKDGMFDKCYDFKNGFGLVKMDNKFNYVNSSGKLVSKDFVENYMELEPVADGVIATGYGAGSCVGADGEYISLI